MKKTLLATSISLAVGVAGATAALGAGAVQKYYPYTFTGGNFTMIEPSGVAGGTNDVSGSWNGTVYTSCNETGVQCNFSGGTVSSSDVANMTLASPTTFFGFAWTASNIQVFGPGTYTFTETNGKTQTMKVGTGQVGAHMMFDWSSTKNIGVVDVWNLNAAYDGGSTTNFYSGAATTSDPWSGTNDHIWRLAAADVPAMINGPFPGFQATFNITDGVQGTGTTSGGGGGGAGPIPQPNTSLNNGGCAIDPNPVGAGNGGAWLIVGAFIAGLGIMKRKRRNGAEPTED